MVDGRELALLSFSIPALRYPVRLSRAEREVAALLCDGWSVAAIARQRCRSPFTVLNQVRSLYARLGVSSHVGLVHRLTAA